MILMWNHGTIAHCRIINLSFKGGSLLTKPKSWINYHRLLGTPTDETWPGVTKLPLYKPTFPKWTRAVDALKKAVPTLCSSGIDLLEKFFIYQPSQRISCKKALQHAYFLDLNTSSLPALPELSWCILHLILLFYIKDIYLVFTKVIITFTPLL